LALPDTQQGLSPEVLTQYEAVRLFTERARAVKPAFALTNDNAPAVAEICQRLDGLPLAIELAAARTKVLSPKALLKRIDHTHTLPLLTQGAATNQPYRHRTLRNAIAWSYDLLESVEKKLFRSLSVFVGGCTLEGAEAVCYSDGNSVLSLQSSVPSAGSGQALDRLAALVDKSLLQHEEQDDGEPRFHMLETIREFALEQMAERGEEQAIRERHARFFLELAEQAAPELMGANQLTWLDTLAREHDNLRAALLWSQQAGKTEIGLRISAALWRFWFVRGYLSEGRKWLSESLEADHEAAPTLRARALTGVGNLAWMQGDYDAARNYHEESLTLWRKLSDSAGMAKSLNNLGNLARVQGEHARSRSYLEQSLAIFRELGDRGNEALALHNLGAVFHEEGDYENARQLHEAALKLLRELQDKRNLASVISSIGEIEADLGDNASAHATLEESLTLWRELGERSGIARDLYVLSGVVADEGDYAAAHALLSQSLMTRYELGSKRGVMGCLQRLAIVARGESEPIRLVSLLAAAEAISQAIGSPLIQIERDHQEKWLSFARAKLGPEAYSAAWERGLTMPIEEAVALALQPPTIEDVAPQEDQVAPVRVSKPPSPRSNLTPREIEVLQLVAAGLTNPGIAAHLHLSTGTVRIHLSSIFSKINVNTRAAAVRYAFEHSLV
jgi:predicted ATPase/DNA-binding CsgD family transcriptional regulator